MRDRACGRLDGTELSQVIQIYAIPLVEVIADEQVWPAVAVQIGEQQGQGLAWRTRQRFGLELSSTLVAPEAGDGRGRIKEPALGSAGPGHNVQVPGTTHVRERHGADNRLVKPRQLHVRRTGERTVTVEQDMASAHPSAEEKIRRPVSVVV